MIDRKAAIEYLAARAADARVMGAFWPGLFDSLASDAATPQSDIDILVDLDQHSFSLQ